MVMLMLTITVPIISKNGLSRRRAHHVVSLERSCSSRVLMITTSENPYCVTNSDNHWWCTAHDRKVCQKASQNV